MSDDDIVNHQCARCIITPWHIRRASSSIHVNMRDRLVEIEMHTRPTVQRRPIRSRERRLRRAHIIRSAIPRLCAHVRFNLHADLMPDIAAS